MTDLLCVLPEFPVSRYANLVPALEKHNLTVSDLLTLDVADIGKRTGLPLLDIKRLRNAILDALHRDLGVTPDAQKAGPDPRNPLPADPTPRTAQGPSLAYPLRHTHASLASQWQTITTLDPVLDKALGGGVPVGYVTEVTGESGAGKTQLLLSLLLSVQLPPPYGLGRPALYISTEAALSTRRLSQILESNPLLRQCTEGGAVPSLDGVISTVTPDLESQDHILHFQVPVEVERRNVGLVVLDSVAANYRAEFERRSGSSGGSNMAARSADLVRLGMLLRDLAGRHHLAVVVANQVADRIGGIKSPTGSAVAPQVPLGGHVQGPLPSQESPLASRSRPLAPSASQVVVEPPSSSIAGLIPSSSISTAPEPPRDSDGPPPPPWQPAPEFTTTPVLLLDHQQRWFTGWGDDPAPGSGTPFAVTPKVPSLGLVWATQVAMRIVLLKYPVYRHGTNRRANSSTTMQSWRRWVKVVFAPHVAPTGPGIQGSVEFEIWAGGLKGLMEDRRREKT
ncbi:hypothetical protein VTK73DRAFT_2011 [Phialemonium thermophilum]|uniref:RecA family profile 1 domain-containing protein n=1 Tax=Phialemonium thermophilum TaxID=223376 RepID=A0ABR3X7C1_9PEZI